VKPARNVPTSVLRTQQNLQVKPARNVLTSVLRTQQNLHVKPARNVNCKVPDFFRWIHIIIISRWSSSISWIPTKMNCYSSHNYKQYGSISNNCSSDNPVALVLLLMR
jgi:hypothetical protein